MQGRFTLDSETFLDANGNCVPILFEVSVQCRDRDGADAEYEIENITHPDRPLDVIELSEFNERDQQRIERYAQEVADDLGPDAYVDYISGAADAAYDAWKNGDYRD